MCAQCRENATLHGHVGDLGVSLKNFSPQSLALFILAVSTAAAVICPHHGPPLLSSRRQSWDKICMSSTIAFVFSTRLDGSGACLGGCDWSRKRQMEGIQPLFHRVRFRAPSVVRPTRGGRVRGSVGKRPPAFVRGSCARRE